MKTIHEEEGYEPAKGLQAKPAAAIAAATSNSEVQKVRKSKSLPPNTNVNGFHKILPGEASSKLNSKKVDKNR